MSIFKTIIKKQSIGGYPCKITIETMKHESGKLAHRIATYHLVPKQELPNYDGEILKRFKGKYLVKYKSAFRTETIEEIFNTILRHRERVKL
jgi:hypothetical protein